MNQNLTPSLIKDINPGADSSNPDLLGVANGNLLFSTFNTNTLNTQLWKTDGSEAGTVVIENFGNNSFPPTNVINANGVVYFLQVSGFSNESLYRSDGTESGTFSIVNVSLRAPADISNLAAVNDTVFYTASDSSDLFQSKLFKIDNSTNQPVQVKQDIQSGGANPENLTGVDNTLFFSANAKPIQEGLDRELWKSDGTDAGTVLVKDINETASSNPNNLTNISGTLFFTADDGTNGRELWKSDGTETGTVLIEDINPGEASSNPDKLTDVSGTAYFIANNGTNGTELWKSDGTETGTVLVKDIITGSEGSNPDNLTNVNGTLFFTASDGSNGTELWKSDGTESGTALVKDINPGGNSSNPANLKNFDGVLYFAADDGSNGTELWKSDGTADGTVLVGDINPGSDSSNPGNFINFDGELYFSASEGVNGRELWALTQTDRDLILGGSSTEKDILVGGDRDNIIDGLKGDDTLTGGGGKDKFVLSGDFGNDVITDFTLGEDEIINTTESIVLAVASVGDAIKVAFSNTGDLLQVNLNGNNQAQLENYLLTLGSDRALPY